MYRDDSLMPKFYHPMDGKWIDEQLSKLDTVTRYRVINAYDVVWIESEEAEQIEYRKLNKARFSANS